MSPRQFMTINKIKRNDGQGHFFDASKAPTRADVDTQLEQIGMSRDECPDGYILGGIVNATRKAKAWTEMGKFDDYNYAILGPLHRRPEHAVAHVGL
ncbi:MAG: hypothetical protein LKE51_11075 [Selenomonas sp.]|nr:hypothetical protein [Selenomonas sp.]